MKLGILVTSIGDFGKEGFYNSQEIGLAKELSKNFSKIIVYKAVSNKDKQVTSLMQDYSNVTLCIVPCEAIGINGLFDVKLLDNSLDALIYFSDTQLITSRIYNWCRKNHVFFLPYIGATESHNVNPLIRMLINANFILRNVPIFRKSMCLAKTPYVKNELNRRKITRCTICPVGLDLSIINMRYNDTSVNKLKQRYGYNEKDKIILFVGRLVEEKRPLDLLVFFEQLYNLNSEYRLLIIGQGHLETEIKNVISDHKLQNVVQIINRVQNSKMWEVYCIADTFVNLNSKEIFGMAILEAMYYECNVIAMHAPGPNFVIENGVNGYLVSDIEQIVPLILNCSTTGIQAHKSVEENFTWESIAKKIYDLVSDNL